MRTPVEISAKILLAEDDNDMRRFLVKALQNAGYAVASFDNGMSAYNRLREEPFELLLTDIVMPEMDGIELARRATELDPEIKVMFITGFAAVALNPDNNAPKDARILSKPFHLRELVSEVERVTCSSCAPMICGSRPGEADAFLNGRLGLGLIPEEVDALLERMEGWPAGLYLTALSLRRAADPRALVNELGASTRHLIDFLETEVLQAHDPPMQELMLRSSVLGRLCGPVCDAVLEQQHSAPMLGALSYSNLFLSSLDEEGGWYRFHPLFAQLLRVELERREPGTAPALHRRAYAWHRDHGMTGEAIAHAITAGAHAEAAELIEASWVSYATRAGTTPSWPGSGGCRPRCKARMCGCSWSRRGCSRCPRSARRQVR